MSIGILTILLFVAILIVFAMGAPVGFALGGPGNALWHVYLGDRSPSTLFLPLL